MDVKPKLENIDLGEVLGVGAALTQLRYVAGEGNRPYLVAPKEWQLHDMEKYLRAPVRPRGNVSLGDAASFIRYVKKHMDEPADGADADNRQTVILVDVINSRFKAVLDHHASDTPGFQEHTCTYNCPLSPQWQLWTANNGLARKKEQEDFAFFIEQNMLDVAEPNGATMLQIVTTLKAAKKVQFDSAIRLNNGQHQLKYHEEIESKAGQQGELQIPEKIALAIPVYVGQQPYRVEAFLRYRIDRGTIVFWYDLITPDRILEHALGMVRKEIEDGTGIKAYAVTSLS